MYFDKKVKASAPKVLQETFIQLLKKSQWLRGYTLLCILLMPQKDAIQWHQ